MGTNDSVFVLTSWTVLQVGVAERDLVLLLDAADAAGWRSPPGGIEHAPLLSLVTAVEQQVLMPVMTALKAIEVEAVAAAAQAAAVQDAALLQQQDTILRCGFGTALDGNQNFSRGTYSTLPPTPFQQQHHAINTEIQMGTSILSACAGPFLPDSTSVMPTLAFVPSCWNDTAQRQPDLLAAGDGQQAVLSSSIRLSDNAKRGDQQRGARSDAGIIQLPAGAGGGAGVLGRQTRPPQTRRARGGCSKSDEQQSTGIVSSCGIGRAGGANGDHRGGGGGRTGSIGSGRQTAAGGLDSGGLQGGGSSNGRVGSATASRGGDPGLGRGLRVVVPASVGRGAGGPAPPAASSQEAGPGWQQPTPGPATRKFRRFGSKRKPATAAAASAATARSTPS